MRLPNLKIKGLVILVLLLPLQGFSATRDLEILGWVEYVRVLNPDFTLKAKLDTGAETSSLDAEIIKKFRKGGKRWVRFRIINRESNEEFIFVRERVRTINVVQHDGSRQSRPVVAVDLCIAGRVIESEVSLINRSEFTYQLLLGRSTLDGIALIDPANTFLSDADCTGEFSEHRESG